jgi:hypothetical protein
MLQFEKERKAESRRKAKKSPKRRREGAKRRDGYLRVFLSHLKINFVFYCNTTDANQKCYE